MATRWRVCRRFIIWKKQVYNLGDLMPEAFTERDVARHIYSRRFERVEVPDELTQQPEPLIVKTEVAPVVEKKEEATSAESNNTIVANTAAKIAPVSPKPAPAIKAHVNIPATKTTTQRK